MDARRVVITGAGAVTPVGNTAEEFWTALTQGKSGVGPITRFDSSALPTRIAGEVKGFDSLRYIDKKDDRKFDPFLKYAVACGVMAVEDAGVDVERVDMNRFGVLVGSGSGGITTNRQSLRVRDDCEFKDVQGPSSSASAPSNAPSSFRDSVSIFDSSPPMCGRALSMISIEVTPE